MFCNHCGVQLGEGDKFCTHCGTAIPQMNLCSNCRAAVPEGAIFCGRCGTRVAKESWPEPKKETVGTNPVDTGTAPSATEQKPAAQQAEAATSQPNPGAYQNAAIPQTGYGIQQPQKYHMISQYAGEPTAGIAKASGTLLVYQDRLEFTKVFGNALGNVSVLGMAVAAREAQKDGKVEIYHFCDVQNAYVGKYMAVMPAVVLVLNNGRVVSFNGTFSAQSASTVVNTILYYKKNH